MMLSCFMDCFGYLIHINILTSSFQSLLQNQQIYMLEDKLPELLRVTSNIKIIVTATYKAKQSLAAKGLSPAIFLDPFYRQKSNSIQQVNYFFKEKQVKPLPEFITIDIEDYNLIRKQDKNSMDDIDEDSLSKKMYELLSQQKIKYLRQIDKSVFADRISIQNFIHNQSFHWFQRANKLYYHALSMGQENFRLNTSDQPMGVVYVIELQKQKSPKQLFQKLKTDFEYLNRKIFQLNLDQSNIKPLLIVLYDINKGYDAKQALQYTNWFKNNTNIHSSFMFRLPINGEQSEELSIWNRFPRAVLSFNYSLKSTDTIKISIQDQISKLQQTITYHRQTIRKGLQQRLDDLIRKYEQVNKTSKKFINFFKGNAPVQKTYNKEQIDERQLADKLFLLEDYKRSYQIYKDLLGKMEKRNMNIENNLTEMAHLCLAISKFYNIKLKSDPFYEIQKSSQAILKYYENRGKVRLKKYLIFLVYCFHAFKNFNRDYIRSFFYQSLKNSFSNNISLNIMCVLLYEQFANMNLFYNTIDYRRYSYDMTRVASRYSEVRLYPYALRCFLIVQNLYRETFCNIEKYQLTQLSHFFLETKNIRQSLQNLKGAWNIYIQKMETQDLQKNEQQLAKLIENYNKMIKEIQRVGSEQLKELIYPNLQIPLILSINLQTKDQTLEKDQKTGSKWQEIGDVLLQSKQLMSAGLNQKQFRSMFRSFDFGQVEEKYLIHRIQGENIPELTIKRNSRNAYVNEPIKLSFFMRNPLRSQIQIQGIQLFLKKGSPKSEIICDHNKVSIKPFKSQFISFTIVPKEPGYLQIDKFQWYFMKLLTERRVKQPNQVRSTIKSSYFKLNILPQCGFLQSKAEFEQYYFEGEKNTINIHFKNSGAEKITKIYLVSNQPQMFGFNSKQINIDLQPNQYKKIQFDVSIPLVQESILSGQQKKLSKIIIVYRSGEKFRATRIINKYHIIRIAKIQNISCQRLSTHLHLLSFEKRKIQGELSCGIQWMIIPGGFQIVKSEAADLVNETHYFFFLRKGNYGLSKYQFQNWVQDIQSYPQQFVRFQNYENSLNVRFLWKKERKIGYLSKTKVPVIINPHGYLSNVYPLTFKINYQKQLVHNFIRKPFLQIPISIKLKNVLCNDDIRITVNFVDSAHSDSAWQGVTEKKFVLKMGSEFSMNVQYVVVRPGIYLISNEIKYSMMNSKGLVQNIIHSDYEKIYLKVKGEGEATKLDFDYFDEFKSLQYEQKTTQINLDNESLI